MLKLSPETSGQSQARTLNKVFDNVLGVIESSPREERLQQQHCHQQGRYRGWIKACELHVELCRGAIARGHVLILC